MGPNNQMSDSVVEIDLVELFYLFRQKLKFIILFAILGGLIAGACTYYLIPPKYEATSKIYIVSASNDSVVNLTDLQIGTNLTADYKELMLSRPVLESAIKNLKLDLTVGQLRAMLKIENPSGTRILQLSTTSTDPKQAQEIANEMANLAVVWLPEVMETNKPNIAEPAIVPDAKCSPSYSKNTAIGAIGLAVLYFGICVVRYLMDDTVRSGEEMERYFGITPLAVVPENKQIKDYAEAEESGKRVFSEKRKRG